MSGTKNFPLKLHNCSKFVTGEEELSRLPRDIQNMFTVLSQDEFRVDISSTELRKQNFAQDP